METLIKHLKLSGFTIHQASSDADTLVVNCALALAKHGTPVFVISNDTDILVLLIYQFTESMADIYMTSEGTQQALQSSKVTSIRSLRCAVGSDVATQLLAIHALSGCDTTSAFFGHGKASVFKKISKSTSSLEQTEIIGSQTATRQAIVAAGLQLISFVYGGKSADSLNHLRYVTFMNITASSSKQLRPERLPPTESAAKFHIYRAHLQVLQWKSLTSCELKPEEWGWKVVDGQYLPIFTDCDPAPKDLMDVVKCKCKTDTKRPCSSQLCSCVKHGVPCLAACKHCNGAQCANAGETVGVEDGDILEDYDDLESDIYTEDTLHQHDDIFLHELLQYDTP